MLRQILARRAEPATVRTNRKAHLSGGAVASAVWLVTEALFLTLVLLLTLVFVLDRADVRSPYAARMLASRMSQTLQGQRFEIDALSVALARSDRFSGISAYGVRLLADDGRVLLDLPQVDVKFTMLDLLKGEIRPQKVEISGPDIFVERSGDGRFKLALGENATPVGGSGAFSNNGLTSIIHGTEFLDRVPELAKLTDVAISGAKLTYRDDVSGREWQVQSADVALQSGAEGYFASVSGQLVQGDGQGAKVNVSARQFADLDSTHVTFQFERATPRDLADEFAALDWMRFLDAPVSGQLDLDVSAAGALTALAGSLRVAAGTIVLDRRQPVGFQSAEADFTYDPAKALFDIARLQIATSAAAMQSFGTLSLQFSGSKHVTSLVGQLQLSDMRVAAGDVFAKPLAFSDGRLAVKVSLDPILVSVGEFSIFDESLSASAQGSFAPGPDGWDYRFDVNGRILDKAAMLSLWPVFIAPKARNWVDVNLLAANFPQVVAGFRKGALGPAFWMQYKFSDVEARFLKIMPVLENASGFGAMDGKSFNINVVEGIVEVAGKGSVNTAGTRITFPAYRMKPAPAVVDLVAEGDFPPIADLINRAPLVLLDRAGFDPSLVSGHAIVQSNLKFPLKKDMRLDEIKSATTAVFTDVVSDRLVKGHHVTAESLQFSAIDSVVSVAGDALLDAIPARFDWVRSFSPGNSGESRLTGNLPVSEDILGQFGFHLPKGSVSGLSSADVSIDFAKGSAPKYTLSIDLKPLEMQIPALDWHKDRGIAGTASFTGNLAEPVDLGPFSIDAKGLAASGNMDLDDGKLRGISFDTIQVNNWLEGAVEYAPGSVQIVGGSIDLRRRDGTASASSTKVTLTGTQVTVTDTIALTGAVGKVRSGQRLEGQLQALVNGGAAVDVVLEPASDGQQISVSGSDAGAILRDAGLFRSARGGDLKLTMVQTGGPGEYRGAFEIHNIRVKDAPVLAALLSAASIIGFLEQLDGQGLAFMTVSGSFTMKDGVITLERAKAVGVSMGISLEGRYQLAGKNFDMNGVISPLYAINGIFEKLPIVGRLLGGKDGEGLLGFSYLLRGSAQAPRISVNPLSILTPGALREIFVPQRLPVPTQ